MNFDGHFHESSLEESGIRSAKSDLELEVCTVDVRDGCIKDDGLLDDKVNKAESSTYHPEALVFKFMIVLEALMVSKVCPNLTKHAKWHALLVREGKTEVAVRRNTSISRRPVQLEAILLVLTTSRATNHRRRQVNFDKLALRQVIHAIKLDANVILTDLDSCERDHLVVLACHNEFVAIRV